MRWPMPKEMTQVKFTIESGIVSAFKARCASAGVSMASVISLWMLAGQPTNAARIRTDTRPHRRKAVAEIVRWLGDIMDRETDYRDAIPEQFGQRAEDADRACEQLAEAIACLEEAF